MTLLGQLLYIEISQRFYNSPVGKMCNSMLDQAIGSADRKRRTAETMATKDLETEIQRAMVSH